MKVLTPGHKYELENFEFPLEDPQILQFIEKGPADMSTPDGSKPDVEPGTLVTANNGTTNEEVLKVLINRLQYLQEKFPCRENAIVITKLQESLFWLEYRTQLRHQQNVEGKALKHVEV